MKLRDLIQAMVMHIDEVRLYTPFFGDRMARMSVAGALEGLGDKDVYKFEYIKVCEDEEESYDTLNVLNVVTAEVMQMVWNKQKEVK